LVRTTVTVGLVGAGLTTAGAAIAHVAGVSFDIDGKPIPLVAFAQLTFIAAVLGGALLAVLNRSSQASRRRFASTAVALTALSCVPSILWPDDAATKAALVVLHLLAAAVIVPVLARRATS
jgi:hypothetical protein